MDRTRRPLQRKAPQLQPNPRATKATGPDVIGEPAKSVRAASGQQAGAGHRPAAAVRRRDHPELDRSNGMAAAHDPGGADRTAQARICRRPRADRQRRFDLPRRGQLRARLAQFDESGTPTTASVSRRRTGRRSRHGSQASRVRTSREATGEDSAGGFAAARCFSALDRGGPRGSRSQWAAPPMARPFGRRAACSISRAGC